MTWQSSTQHIAHNIRRRVLEHTIKSNGGYLSQACSSAETLAVLYTQVMKLNPSAAPMIPPPFTGVPSKTNPRYTGAAYNGAHTPKADRFFLSAVHYALPLYSTLIETGRMSPDGLAQFNQDGSTVEMIGAEHSPGLEVTGGSLAQTISQAGGIALARKLKNESGRVFVLMSDGEYQSGQAWEAIQALAFYKLDNMIIYVDVNGQQCDGKMTEVMNIEPLLSRLESFGACVAQVDGHDLDALAASAAIAHTDQPLIVLAYTDPAKDMPILNSRRPKLHYVRFKDEAEKKLFAEFLKTF